MTVVGMWARGEINLQPRPHPAKYSTKVMNAIDHVITAEADRLGRRLRILDGFAGTGRIHRLREAAHLTVGVELEPEWAMAGMAPHTEMPGPMVVGDCTRLPFRPGSFDALVESPCFGNRMGDHHEAKDPCKHKVRTNGVVKTFGLADCPRCGGTGLSERNTYRHKLNRMPTRNSAAVMSWGAPYRDLHARGYVAKLEALVPGGLVVVNIKNHPKTVRKGEPQVEMRVSEWHVNELMAQGCNIVRIDPIATRGLPVGANYDARMDGELLVVMRAPSK